MAPLTLAVIDKIWLTTLTLELRFKRPNDFSFLPGQKIRFIEPTFSRDYTLINGPIDEALAICVRLVPGGRFSPRLAAAAAEEVFRVEGPIGYFTMQPSRRPVVWVATGTGIAPFVAFARAGNRAHLLLHGVRQAVDLYYRDLFTGRVDEYRACISGQGEQLDSECFCGRVTDYLEQKLSASEYDFYLCGRSEMIAEAMGTIDRRFGNSSVFIETFY
jgi:ferredoxin-NADP reductase